MIQLAFETVTGLATFDLASGIKVPSVSPVLYDLIYKERDRAFLSRIADGPVVPNTEWSWWQRTLRPLSVLAVEPMDASEPGLDVATGHADRLVIGALLLDEADPTEIMQVTAIAAPTLTVTRGFGGTTATTHADAALYRIVGMPAQEMSSTGLDLLRAPSQVSNYSQIFRRDLKASRSSQGVQSYTGYHLNAKRLQEKLEEIRDELEQVALFSVPAASTPAGSDTVVRSTGGLLYYVAQLGTGTNVNSTAYTGQTAADLKAKIDSAAKWLVENGGDPNFIMAGGNIFGTFMDLDSDKVRFEVTDGVRGALVTAIRTKYGPILDLVYDRWFPTKYLIVGDYRKMSMRLFANGGNPHIEQLAKTKDGEEFMIIGELGFELQNGRDAFYLYKDITVA